MIWALNRHKLRHSHYFLHSKANFHLLMIQLSV